MNLTITRTGDVTFVRVGEARLMYPLLSDFAGSVASLLTAGDKKVVIDLAGVNYIDSASIGCLMDVHRLLQEKGGVLRLSGLQPRVETMISMTGVHKIIDLFRDEAEAVLAFPAKGSRGKGNA